MGQVGGFLKIQRVGFDKRRPSERVRDYKPVLPRAGRGGAAPPGRALHGLRRAVLPRGLPAGQPDPRLERPRLPGRLARAIEQLHATNNFPEFTGLICPAPCESACVLDINDDPVTIEQIELGIVERAWQEGWIVPEPPQERTGMTVGVVGSGPAGMALAAELNKRGHRVTVYERDEAPGGLMRYGVPDAKLEKWIIDRRVGARTRGSRLRVQRRRGPERVGGGAARAPRRGRDGHRLARAPRPRGARARARAACTTRWTTSTSATASWPRWRAGPPAGRSSRSAPRASAWWSSAAATRAWTASPTPCARAPTEARMLDVYPELPASGRDGHTPWPRPPSAP